MRRWPPLDSSPPPRPNRPNGIRFRYSALRRMAKISAMALDLLPDNHPGIDPASVFVQVTALRETESLAAS